MTIDAATSLHSTLRGNPSAMRRAQLGWGIYETAISPFYALVPIFIFSAYFVNHVAPDPITGQSTWGMVQAVSGFAVAIFSPILGALADHAGPRKPWIALTSLIGGIGMAMLWFVQPDPSYMWIGFVIMVVTLIMLEYAHVFFYAMLPSITDDDSIGLVSGVSYGVSQLFTIFALAAVLIAFALPGTVDLGFVPDAPLFGIDQAAYESDRVVGPIAALWFGIVCLPLFFMVPDKAKATMSTKQALGHGLTTLLETMRSMGHFKNVAAFLLARMVFYDGLNAVFFFGGVFAASIFGWGVLELALYGMLSIGSSGLGGLVGAWADPKFGSKPTILAALVVAAIMVLGFVSVDQGQLFFVLHYDVASDAAAFSTVPEKAILVMTAIFSAAVGPVIASSRTMMAKLSPHEHMTEFFGLYALAGKATSFVAPMLIAVITAQTESLHLGFSVTIFLIVGGAIALAVYVKEERAIPLKRAEHV